jgi:ribosomal protein L40E
MICNSCGIENPDAAQHCTHCGTMLREKEPKARGKACFSCGKENPFHSKSCAHCGINLRHHPPGSGGTHSQSRRKMKYGRKADPLFRWHPATIGLVLLGGALAITLGLQLIRNSQLPPAQSPVVETKSADPKLEANVIAVAGKFICSCGSCGDKPLDICACGRAVEERQFIRSSLQAGQSIAQVIAALNNAYGWMNQDSAEWNNSAPTSPQKPAKVQL